MIKSVKKTITFILLVCTTISLSAQEQKEYTGSLLWKVSGKDLTQPSYILGTHHLTDIAFLDSIAGYNKAIDEVRQVAGEILMSDKAALQQKLQTAAMMPAGETYRTLLSDDDYAKLDQNLTAFFGAGIAQLGILKPGMLFTLYGVTVYQKIHPELNMQAHVAIDEYIQKKAIEKGLPIIGLETIEDQIYILLDAEPMQQQAEDLVCVTSQGLDLYKEQLRALDKYYHEGNLTALYNLSFNNPYDPCPSTEKYKNIILRGRNNKWLAKLPRIMKDKPTLIAVGALHLAGNEGLLTQLVLQGYTVEAVK